MILESLKPVTGSTVQKPARMSIRERTSYRRSPKVRTAQVSILDRTHYSETQEFEDSREKQLLRSTFGTQDSGS